MNRRNRQRFAARVVGSLAALAMIVVVGCTTITQGTGQVDAADAPVYRTSLSASVAISAASSSARESARQQSLSTQAVHSSCNALSTSSVDAIRALNAFVDAANTGAEIGPKVGPAVDALNRSADLVNTSLSDALSAELRDALTAWVNAARSLAATIAGDSGVDDFNAEVARLNDARGLALGMCDASY